MTDVCRVALLGNDDLLASLGLEVLIEMGHLVLLLLEAPFVRTAVLDYSAVDPVDLFEVGRQRETVFRVFHVPRIDFEPLSVEQALLVF